MILVLNCIFDAEARAGFERRTAPALAQHASVPFDLAHLEDEIEPERLVRATHVLLSGSELSASQRNPLDDRLMGWIRHFAAAKKPVLGICYGHQMIARALAGDGTCRRAARPEFGWKRVTLADNPLFAGIEGMVVAHSHYDEVVDLPAEFEVIAHTDDCAVQAFQLRGSPIWGVQFHPEVDAEQGEAMFARNCADDPRADEIYVDERRGPDPLAQNARIFETFFRT